MQDEERRRIARELHDSVGQLLAAMSMNMAIVERDENKLGPEGRKAFQENRSFVQQILRGIRTISHLLHPPLLDESGLPSALGWYVEEFSERSGIDVTLNCSPSVGRFSSDIETAIFRIVQECLGNIHRHAQSPTAAISLETCDSGVKLVVSDQGRGISADKQFRLSQGARAGVGVRGMQERIAQLAGQLKIESNGTGTTVTATIPCPRSNQSAAGADVA
jgi:signal transduction histidine kinase